MWDPNDLPRVDTVEDPTMAAEIGMLPGVDAAGRFNRQWDGPLKDDSIPTTVDCGWIGEDAEGVWLCRHPLVELAQRPELQDVVTEYRFGQHRIRARDYRERSNFELQAKLIMANARAREQVRRVQKPQVTHE